MMCYLKTMTRHNLTTIFIICAAILSAIPAQAIRARRGIMTETQADGSTIDIRILGDEHFHVTTTSDGYPLVEEDGIYYYATTDSEGRLVASTLKAQNPSARSLESQLFLSTIDKSKVMAETVASRRQRNASRANAAINRAPANMLTTTFPGHGEQKVLVILAEYSDVKFSISDPFGYFNSMLNEEGFTGEGATGSARDYFLASSAGQFSPIFDVYGPVTLPNNRTYYGRNNIYGDDDKAHEMIIHACDILKKEGVDFTQYDRDDDGIIDNVYLFYAGRGEATGGGKNTVWPHAWEIWAGANETHIYDGKRLDHYACSNELLDSRGTVDGIGTFCHEFSHVLGLPDLYYTGDGDYEEYCTPDTWSILDYGPYNNNSRTPPLYSSFERMSMGWLTPVKISRAANMTLTPIADNIAYMVETDKENEFFLFENRQTSGWDKYLEGSGMLVWHIDYNSSLWHDNEVNNTANHQNVDVVEATARTDYQAAASDAFPGPGKVTSFTYSTTPRFASWSGKNPGFPITGIALAANGNVTFKAAEGAALYIAAPTPLKASEIESGSFTANWESVADAERYLITLTDETSGKTLLTNVDAGTSGCHTITGLTPDNTYSYTVRSVGNTVVSSPSAKMTVTTSDLSDIDSVTIDRKGEISVRDRHIIISGSEEEVEIFTLQGIRIYRGQEREIAVRPGLYVVAIGGHAEKVAVK